MGYKPTISKISAFNALTGTTVSFGWKGEQSFYNELIIKDSETLNVVYQHKIKTMSLKHDMDITQGTNNSNTTAPFANGKQYQATISTFDRQNILTGTSSPVTFWCFSEPTFEITNLDVLSGIVTMSSIYLNFKYFQKEGEILNEYYVFIYDDKHNLLSQSPIRYGTSSNEFLEYRIEGLTNLNTYGVRVQGMTVNEMPVDTGIKEFSVKYDKMGVGAIVYISDLGNGTVAISSNYKVTDAKYYPEDSDPVYIDGDKIDLRKDGTYVDFFDGINFGSKDYEIALSFQNPNKGVMVRLIGVNEGEATISYRNFIINKENDDLEKFYFELKVFNSNQVYRAETNLFSSLSENDTVVVLVQQKNGLYNIKLQINGMEVA